jgi:hypothetical protein
MRVDVVTETVIRVSREKVLAYAAAPDHGPAWYVAREQKDLAKLKSLLEESDRNHTYGF